MKLNTTKKTTKKTNNDKEDDKDNRPTAWPANNIYQEIHNNNHININNNDMAMNDINETESL